MKKIPLTQGQFALVDDEDFEELNKHKWQANKSLHTYYAVRSFTVSKKIRINIKMHRQILGITDSKIKCDHIDFNGLNNQRYNLREATHLENMLNRKSKINSSSNYKGVYWRKDNKIWGAKINLKGNQIHLGFFLDEIEAAKTYDKKAKELFGQFAYLNFK
jgi:hypothetical protein